MIISSSKVLNIYVFLDFYNYKFFRILLHMCKILNIGMSSLNPYRLGGGAKKILSSTMKRKNLNNKKNYMWFYTWYIICQICLTIKKKFF